MNHFISDKDSFLRSRIEMGTHLVDHSARTKSLYVVRDGLDDRPCSPPNRCQEVEPQRLSDEKCRQVERVLTYDVKDDRNQDQLCPAEYVGDLGCCWLLYKGVMKSSSSGSYDNHHQSRSKKALIRHPVCQGGTYLRCGSDDAPHYGDRR
jgi:hypothetical protein